jgi:hypothetical protein
VLLAKGASHDEGSDLVLTIHAMNVQMPIPSSGALWAGPIPPASQVWPSVACVRPEYRSDPATTLFVDGAASRNGTASSYSTAETGTNGAAFINKVRPLSPPDHGTG